MRMTDRINSRPTIVLAGGILALVTLAAAAISTRSRTAGVDGAKWTVEIAGFG